MAEALAAPMITAGDATSSRTAALAKDLSRSAMFMGLGVADVYHVCGSGLLGGERTQDLWTGVWEEL